jgi:hypothetical protein
MMIKIRKKRITTYLMNYPGTDLEGMRNTTKEKREDTS